LGVLLASNKPGKGAHMHEWSFSATAEWVVGALLVATIVAMVFV
jgi:hypothetical protein